MMAAATSTIQVGHAVSNFITRHLAVTASAIGSLDEGSGGRAFLGVASGDSAIYNIGGRPSKIAQMREAIVAIRKMLKGEAIDWKGARIQTPWVSRPVPIMMAAEGPLALQLAGEHADIVICGLGLTPTAVEISLRNLEIGARRAGRALRDIDIWVLSRINLGDDREALVQSIKMELASNAHHAFSFTLNGKGVPTHLEDCIRSVVQNYDPTHHVGLGESPNARLVEDPELLNYLTERFAILGSVNECVAQVQQLEALGVNGVLFSGDIDGRAEVLMRLGDVITAYRA
jgi:5,10-methylenetetrahydromethanopterin reductase